MLCNVSAESRLSMGRPGEKQKKQKIGIKLKEFGQQVDQEAKKGSQTQQTRVSARSDHLDHPNSQRHASQQVRWVSGAELGLFFTLELWQQMASLISWVNTQSHLLG